MKSFVAELKEHQAVMACLMDCAVAIETSAELLIETLKQGGKIIFCGNGGSAANA